MIDDIQERHEVGGLVYGIGADSLGSYAECYDAATGRRVESQGPCLDLDLVRFMVAGMKVANARIASEYPLASVRPPYDGAGRAG